LSFGAFKTYIDFLPGFVDKFVHSKSNGLDKSNFFVELVDSIKQKADNKPAWNAKVKSSIASLNLASEEGEPSSPSVQDLDHLKLWIEKSNGEIHLSLPEAESTLCGTTTGYSVLQGLHDQKMTPTSLLEIEEMPHATWCPYCVDECESNLGVKTDTEPVMEGFNEHKDGKLHNQEGQSGFQSASEYKGNSAKFKAAVLVRGEELTPEMHQQVIENFPYRWTKDNPKRTKQWPSCTKCNIETPFVSETSSEGHNHPTVPLTSDYDWVRQRAFHFTNDGRLKHPQHAEPAWAMSPTSADGDKMASIKGKACIQCGKPATEMDNFGRAHCQKCKLSAGDVSQKFAMEKESYSRSLTDTESKLPCCGGYHGNHRQTCPVYTENFNRTVDLLKSVPKRKEADDATQVQPLQPTPSQMGRPTQSPVQPSQSQVQNSNLPKQPAPTVVVNTPAQPQPEQSMKRTIAPEIPGQGHME
jgi:hypothetical protein